MAEHSEVLNVKLASSCSPCQLGVLFEIHEKQLLSRHKEPVGKWSKKEIVKITLKTLPTKWNEEESNRIRENLDNPSCKGGSRWQRGETEEGVTWIGGGSRRRNEGKRKEKEKYSTLLNMASIPLGRAHQDNSNDVSNEWNRWADVEEARGKRRGEEERSTDQMWLWKKK